MSESRTQSYISTVSFYNNIKIYSSSKSGPFPADAALYSRLSSKFVSSSTVAVPTIRKFTQHVADLHSRMKAKKIRGEVDSIDAVL